MLKLRLDYYRDGFLEKRLGVLRLWGASTPVLAAGEDEPGEPLEKTNKDWAEVYEALRKVYGN